MVGVQATKADVRGANVASKHILNAQVSIRAPCCKKWYDVSGVSVSVDPCLVARRAEERAPRRMDPSSQTGIHLHMTGSLNLPLELLLPYERDPFHLDDPLTSSAQNAMLRTNSTH